MAHEILSMFVVGGTCAVAGWGAIFLTAKFQTHPAEIGAAVFGRRVSKSGG
jgi:hypothetical protein